MSEDKLKEIADDADLIIAGYTFKKNNNFIQVLNLEHSESAAVINLNGEMIETTMNDAELSLIQSYYLINKEFWEEN